MPRRVSFAYYCSGHGYGHATRVSAIATHLCSLPNAPSVHIISSAPQLVFQDSINVGARYRYAFIDPVIVQPLAYYVDRRKSVDDLRQFLRTKERKVEEEATWLRENKIDCVLSDAAFLACLASNAANIPSVLITNFTFDSVYSYLSSPLVDSPPTPLPNASSSNTDECHCLSPTKAQSISKLLQDIPIPLSELAPLVNELHAGYRCSDLLLLLPGHIPIPSFHLQPALPSFTWIDPAMNRFLPEVTHALSQNPNMPPLLPPVNRGRRRSVRQAPLVVRHPSPDIYTLAGRSRLLESIGVPSRQHGLETKILIVSFGGQVFKKPTSRATSRSGSPVSDKRLLLVDSPAKITSKRRKLKRCDSSSASSSPPETPSGASEFEFPFVQSEEVCNKREDTEEYPEFIDTHNNNNYTLNHSIGFDMSNDSPLKQPLSPPNRLATPHHLWVPGAPPSNKPHIHPLQLRDNAHRRRGLSMGVNTGISITISGATPMIEQVEWDGPIAINGTDTDTSSDADIVDDSSEEEDLPHMLPDSSWIAIVCGASKSGEGEDDEMPERFYTAPRDVYMPDLTAVADVLLGKLGYGTVSECVDACTPFVYVPRPLFIEEHGLRHYLTAHGVGVELPRAAYEAGDWASSIAEAYAHGKDAKARKRIVGDTGVRKAEMRVMAEELVRWVEETTK